MPASAGVRAVVLGSHAHFGLSFDDFILQILCKTGCIVQIFICLVRRPAILLRLIRLLTLRILQRLRIHHLTQKFIVAILISQYKVDLLASVA